MQHGRRNGVASKQAIHQRTPIVFGIYHWHNGNVITIMSDFKGSIRRKVAKAL
jgi:hypothetical protein